jgi:hypothetical protein
MIYHDLAMKGTKVGVEAMFKAYQGVGITPTRGFPRHSLLPLSSRSSIPMA